MIENIKYGYKKFYSKKNCRKKNKVKSKRKRLSALIFELQKINEINEDSFSNISHLDTMQMVLDLDFMGLETEKKTDIIEKIVKTNPYTILKQTLGIE